MRLVKIFLVMVMVAGVLLHPATVLAGFGIQPGKVYIDNLYPGAQAEFLITIYNQNDYESTFVVRARTPDYTAEDEGYGIFPHLEWITVTPERVIISAGDTGEVVITVDMPEDADYGGRKSEVWISFNEEGAPGMVQIELASRLFISTRVEKPSETEPKPETPVTGSGGVGITAEALLTPEPAPQPSPSPSTVPASPLSPAIIVSLLGVILVGGAAFILVKRKRQA